jgi:hypothetical protein
MLRGGDLTKTLRFVFPLLLIMVLVVGCHQAEKALEVPGEMSTGSGKGASGGDPVKPQERDMGPYHVYPLMSRDHVERLLGAPPRTGSQGTVVKWFYDSKGLEVRMVNDKVSYVIQRSGRVLDDVAIGDDAAHVRKLAAKVETNTDGTETASFERDHVLYVVTIDKGIVREVTLCPPLEV